MTAKRIHRIAVDLVMALATTFAPALALAQGQQQSARQPALKQEDAVHAVATVVSVDKAHRSVTLMDEHGRQFDVAVPADVTNLDRIKPGDRLNIGYVASTAIAIRKPGEPAPPTGERESVEHGTGSTPSRLRSWQTTMSAEVLAVDAKKHTVTLRGPKGTVRTVTVEDPQLQSRLSDLKAGDHVDVTMTEALAVSVEPMQRPR
jgi:hypothetical protein